MVLVVGAGDLQRSGKLDLDLIQRILAMLVGASLTAQHVLERANRRAPRPCGGTPLAPAAVARDRSDLIDLDLHSVTGSGEAAA